MKKIFLLVLMLAVSSVSFAQKKKPTAKPAAAKSSSTLTKVDNISAELVKGDFYIAIGGTKDTIQLKKISDKAIVSDCKITSFKAGTNPLYLVSWIEKSVNKTDLKTEEITETYATIFDATSKTKALHNVQKNTKITEKVFLDKLKTASETQEKMRREGFEFSLNPDGSILLKNKGRETKMVYNATEKKYK